MLAKSGGSAQTLWVNGAGNSTNVTPGASNAEGSWTQIASALSADVIGIALLIRGGSTSGQIKDQLLDVGVDPAGGTSYSAIVSNFAMGQSTVGQQAPIAAYFPLFIPSGSTVAVRIQGSNSIAGTVAVSSKFYGQSSRPENLPVGTFSETIGTITGSAGVGFTPGNGSFGSWTSLGTTSRDTFWWQLGVGLSSSTMGSALVTAIELAYGDGTNKHVICRRVVVETGVEALFEQGVFQWLAENAYHPVPAGSTIYVRGKCSAAPTSGWHAVGVGVGGDQKLMAGRASFSFRAKGMETTVSVTPGASGAEGSWTQIAASGDISQECFGVALALASGFTSGQVKNHVVDIGVDPAGGTSYTAVVTDFVAGSSASGSDKTLWAPIRIPSGSSVAVRIAGSNATAGTVNVRAEFYGSPDVPALARAASFSETLGVSGTAGTAFTPGNGSFGSWTSLGTTSRNLWAVQLGEQAADSTKGAEITICQLAVGDVTNKLLISEYVVEHTSLEEEPRRLDWQLTPPELLSPLPAGAELWVRGQCNNSPDSPYQAAVVGFGGS